MKRKHILLSIVVVIILVAFQLYRLVKQGIQRIPEEAYYTPEEACSKYNFPMQRHYVTTQDGYILTVLRIKHGNQSSILNTKPLLLQHGLLATPMGWLTNVPERRIPFILANAGYDVWIGSSRGNQFARNHTTLDPDKDKSFWDFSWEEMGKYDLFAQLKYIKNITGIQKLGYVGHSQGTLQMFYALSEFQESLKDHIHSFSAMAPVARVGNNKSTLTKYFSLMTSIFQFFGQVEYMPRSALGSGIQRYLCSNWERGCNKYQYYFTQGMPENNDMEQAAILFTYFPGGTSIKNQKHWNQMMRINKFQLYDYGQDQNIRRYNQRVPPEVNLTKIKQMPIGLFIGKEDLVTVSEDIDWLRSQLNPKVVSFDKMYEGYGHITFGIGKNVSEFVHDLLSFLEKNEKQ